MGEKRGQKDDRKSDSRGIKYTHGCPIAKLLPQAQLWQSHYYFSAVVAVKYVCHKPHYVPDKNKKKSNTGIWKQKKNKKKPWPRKHKQQTLWGERPLSSCSSSVANSLPFTCAPPVCTIFMFFYDCPGRVTVLHQPKDTCKEITAFTLAHEKLANWWGLKHDQIILLHFYFRFWKYIHIFSMFIKSFVTKSALFIL